MLRLEGCLTGEAAETVKGLGYSEAAYETAKARKSTSSAREFRRAKEDEYAL